MRTITPHYEDGNHMSGTIAAILTEEFTLSLMYRMEMQCSFLRSVTCIDRVLERMKNAFASVSQCSAGTYKGVERDVQLTTHALQIANKVLRCIRPAQPTHCANIRKELHNSD